MITYNNIAELSSSQLVIGDVVQILGEDSPADRAVMFGVVRDPSFVSGNRLIPISKGLKVEISPELVITSGDVSNSEVLSTGSIVRRRLSDRFSDTINVLDYGVVGDGVSDDTAAIRAAHTEANKKGSPVSYAGVKRYAINTNAQVPINTDVDFHGAVCVILDGLVQTPSYTSINSVFVVKDPRFDIENASGTFTGSLLAQSRTPTLGLFDGEGVARIKVPYKIPNRWGDGSDDYEQVFNVIHKGECSLPLSANLTAYAYGLTVSYRKAPEGRITISNPCLFNSNFNNQTFIKIERCKVTIDGFSMDLQNAVIPETSINRIIYGYYTSDTLISNMTAIGQPVKSGDPGTYTLSFDYSADITYKNVRSIGKQSVNWPSVVSYHCNGFNFIDCELHRIDAHAGGHNYYIDNCKLFNVGVNYGWGGGYLTVENTTAYRCFNGIVESRIDYGGSWFGEVSIKNCRIELNDSIRTSVATFSVGSNENTQYPKSVVIDGIHIGGIPKDFISDVEIKFLVSDKNKTEVVAPSNISVYNVTSNYPFSFNMQMDHAKMVKDPKVFRYNVSVDNVFAGRLPNKSNGIQFTAGTNNDAPQVYLRVSDSQYVYVNTTGSPLIREIHISDSMVSGVETGEISTAKSPMVILKDCQFRYPVEGLGRAPKLGSGKWASDRFTSIDGGVMFDSAYDLSDVTSVKSLNVMKGTANHLLPSGWTYEDLFIGKRVDNYFRAV